MNTFTDTKTWLWMGGVEGAKWGLGLAFAYILWQVGGMITAYFSIMLTDVIEQVSTGSAPLFQSEIDPESITVSLLFLALFITVGSVVGGIPALIIGVVSGVVLGGMLSHPAIRPSPKMRFAASALFGIVVALSVNLAVLPLFSDEFGSAIQMSYIGLPSIAYVGVCLLLSQRIPLLVERARAKESPVNPLMSPVMGE